MMNNKLKIAMVGVGAAALALSLPALGVLHSGTTTDRLDRIETNTCVLLAQHNAPVPPDCGMVTTTVATTTTVKPTTTNAPTTVKPTTTNAPTTVAPSTTNAPTTVAASTVASSTTAPGPTTTVHLDPAANCGIPNAAFCETFDGPALNRTGRTGDLDSVLWGVSRGGNYNPGQNLLNDVENTLIETPCGSATVRPPGDVKICNGKMFEAQNDNHIVTSVDTYPKQPFNFANRVGTVVFDVSGDSQGSHAAWPDFVITDKPIPGVRTAVGGSTPIHAANEIGFSMSACFGHSEAEQVTGVDLVFKSVNNVYSEQTNTGACITRGSFTAMNHVKVLLSQSHLEVWGTDAGGFDYKLLASVDNLGLNFTQGLVWLNDVHYNARKSNATETGTQFEHTFAWDNLGFDGPKTYRDLGYDVPDANINKATSTQEGYFVGNQNTRTFNVLNVHTVQAPTGAQVVFNTYAYDTVIPSISVNGNPFIDTPWPFDAQGFATRTISVPVPLSQIHDGTNTLTFKSTSDSQVVANISLIMVAGAPVP